MTTPVATAPGVATLSPRLGGAVLVSQVGGAALVSTVGGATLAAQPIRDARITTSPIAPPANPAAVVGAAVVGTSTVG